MVLSNSQWCIFLYRVSQIFKLNEIIYKHMLCRQYLILEFLCWIINYQNCHLTCSATILNSSLDIVCVQLYSSIVPGVKDHNWYYLSFFTFLHLTRIIMLMCPVIRTLDLLSHHQTEILFNPEQDLVATIGIIFLTQLLNNLGSIILHLWRWGQVTIKCILFRKFIFLNLPQDKWNLSFWYLIFVLKELRPWMLGVSDMFWWQVCWWNVEIIQNI